VSLEIPDPVSSDHRRDAAHGRVPILCALWLLLAIGAAAGGLLISETALDILGPVFYLAAAYAVLAFACECLGASIKQSVIRIPWRPLKKLPIAILGRARISIHEVSRITSGHALLGIERAQMRFLTRGRTNVYFSSRASKLAFFDAARRNRPDIGIYKD